MKAGLFSGCYTSAPFFLSLSLPVFPCYFFFFISAFTFVRFVFCLIVSYISCECQLFCFGRTFGPARGSVYWQLVPATDTIVPLSAQLPEQQISHVPAARSILPALLRSSYIISQLTTNHSLGHGSEITTQKQTASSGAGPRIKLSECGIPNRPTDRTSA